MAAAASGAVNDKKAIIDENKIIIHLPGCRFHDVAAGVKCPHCLNIKPSLQSLLDKSNYCCDYYKTGAVAGTSFSRSCELLRASIAGLLDCIDTLYPFNDNPKASKWSCLQHLPPPAPKSVVAEFAMICDWQKKLEPRSDGAVLVIEQSKKLLSMWHSEIKTIRFNWLLKITCALFSNESIDAQSLHAWQQIVALSSRMQVVQSAL